MMTTDTLSQADRLCYGTIVIPVLNEAGEITPCLAALQGLRRQGWKVVVVDGGSQDDTVEQAAKGADVVIPALRGRANQMNAGARLAEGEVLVFLHVDTRLPDTFAADMAIFVSSPGQWGRFDVRFRHPGWSFRIISTLMNLRSRATSVATGDQVMFFRREFFRRLGGFPLIPLMEDVALSKKARAVSIPFFSRACVTTSSRRWEQKGVVSTVLLMWALRLAYVLGVSPQRLAAWYYRR